MERIFHNPNNWEDYKNGMYNSKCTNQLHKIDKAIQLLSNPTMFENYGRKMIDKWIYSSEHQLTNTSRNRQAWIGQASCCYFAGVPEFLTKEAWHQLSDKQKDRANETADKIIRYFERNLIYKYQLKIQWENDI